MRSAAVLNPYRNISSNISLYIYKERVEDRGKAEGSMSPYIMHTFMHRYIQYM